MTERIVIVVGGLTGFGTLAAGEFLTNPEYIQDFAKHAPQGWDRKNMQLVISTRVIDGTSGPPPPPRKPLLVGWSFRTGRPWN